MTRPPIVNFTIASDAVSDAAAFKMALHFFASFVEEVARDVADMLLPYVLGDQSVDDIYLRVPPFDEALFRREWPPRHEVTCFPAGDETYVSVLLFGVYPHMCKLPLRLPAEGGIRYRQALLGDLHPKIDLNVAIPEIDWERRLNDETSGAFGAEIVNRLDEIENFVKRRELLEQCEAAAARAEARAMRGGDFFEWYMGELQLEGFDSVKVSQIVQLGRLARARGRDVWEFDVVFG